MAKILNLAIILTHCFLILNKDFVSAHIVHAWGNQLVPKFLLKPSDTVNTLNICMKKFDTIKILFDKMTAFLTCHYFTLCVLIRVLLVLR